MTVYDTLMGLGANGLGDFLRPFPTAEFFDQEDSEIDGGARASGREDAAVGHGAFIGEEGGEFGGDGEVRGVAASGKQACVVQHGGSGADGGEPASGVVVGEHGGANARIGAKEFYAGTAGEEEEIEEFVADGGERRVGVEREGVAAGDVDGLAERGDGDSDAGTAQEVDGGDGFEFFDAFGENGQNGGHDGVV